jgi:hypothetical protein
MRSMGKWLTIVNRNPVSDRHTLNRFGDLPSIVHPEKSRNFLFRRWVWPSRHLDRHWKQHYSWHSFRSSQFGKHGFWADFDAPGSRQKIGIRSIGVDGFLSKRCQLPKVASIHSPSLADGVFWVT